MVIKYQDLKTAEKAMEELHKLEKKKVLDVDDVVLVEKTKRGRVKMKHTSVLTTGKGSIRGEILGLIITHANSDHQTQTLPSPACDPLVFVLSSHWDTHLDPVSLFDKDQAPH